MPALTITAVDSGTDQLTVIHGLQTGAGPVAIYTATGSVPDGLFALTDYWVIRVDDTHIKLAFDAADAAAGIAIDITSAGSGALELLIGLPYVRPRTYAPGSQLKSEDINAFIDDDIALWRFLVGEWQGIWSGIKLMADQHIAVSGTGRFKHGERTLVIPASAFTGDVDSTLSQMGYRTVSAVGFLYAPVLLPAGKRITSVAVFYDPQSSGGITPRLSRRHLGSGTRNYIWEGVSDNSGSAIEVQIGSDLDYTIDPIEAYEVEVMMGGANNRLYYAKVSYDEP